MVQQEASLQPRILSQTGLTEPYAPASSAQPRSLPTATMPTSAWCTVHVRLSIPSVQDESAWYEWVHGREPPNEQERQQMVERAETLEATGPETCDTGCDSESEVSGMLDVPSDILEQYGYVFREPSFRTLRSLSTEDAIAVMAMIRRWMQHPQFTHQAVTRAAIHPIHARWLFAILAQLDRQLSSDDIASLRTLARVCMKCIARVRGQVDYLCDEKPDSLEAEMGAWMIITAVAGVWGQRDLWNEAQGRVT
ncbi:hypothetical protein MCAP1_003184 [Malassezia caprae]|uniref:Uncharacterized protein n=1 Tax=Malassezia caprae TaxID=1381934 RepID=A0AAF0E9Q9_9BASI|nr:hypothetical protein MCAP1_003184 [Malassezia caprae]